MWQNDENWKLRVEKEIKRRGEHLGLNFRMLMSVANLRGFSLPRRN